MLSTFPQPSETIQADDPLPAPKPPKPAYRWLVLADPTGDFAGRWFRHADIIYGVWPDGMMFFNPRNGRVFFTREGRLCRLKTEPIHV